MGSADDTDGGKTETGVMADIRGFWDADAATYDNSPSHYPQRPQEQAAWAGKGLLDSLLGTHPRWAVVAGS